MLTKKNVLMAIFAAAVPTVAMAHPGHGTGGGFVHGVLHPLTGLDHVLVIIAVALLSIRLGGHRFWTIPAAFIGCCAVGGMIAFAGITLPMIEPMIAASLLVAGVLLVRRQQEKPLVVALVPLFGIFQGYAHVAETGSAISLAPYAVGLLIASLLLTAITVGCGLLIERLQFKELLSTVCRVAGTGFAAAAILMLFV
ncbi:HupE / UreJ protein [Novipirellula aureliae]|uniref:HupE / UreJ protein n=1 Tax=Novipirellula aureliae TaxID=2527966 RepID=A0A5C6DUA8_9BACT|nr:HupE/UreJ family protein [Novipirellula aureliae]TWU40308.1 HupE / UreJ protein [Novipirellula aureliae]